MERVRSADWKVFNKSKFTETMVELTIEKIAHDGHFH
jgi:hypothetical protein